MMLPLPALSDWRAALHPWLNTHGRTMPDSARTQLTDFQRRFPPDTLGDLTLDSYVQGRGDRNTFSYWLEWGTPELGGMRGGSVAKFGVWWDKAAGTYDWNKRLYASAQAALDQIKAGLLRMIAAVRAGQFAQLDEIGAAGLGSNRNSLRGKPLYLYFPQDFLPIINPDDIGYFSAVFGLEPLPGLLTRNRQLLAYLQRLPEFQGFDTRQMMMFLYDTFRPPRAVPAGTITQQFWRVAPDEGAKLWAMCRAQNCIVIHWLDDIDFSLLADKEAIRQALLAAGKPGGGTNNIWSFTNEMEPGQIVVANQGEDTVVGIGVLTSDYIAPTDPGNPSADPHSRHSRWVDWRITDPVTLPFKFTQRTIQHLRTDQWAQIKSAYLQQNPQLADTFAMLEAEPAATLDPQAIVEAILPDPASRTRCLHLLADSLVEAHRLAPAGWALCLRGSKPQVRLDIRGIETFILNAYQSGNVGLMLADLPDMVRTELATLKIENGSTKQIVPLSYKPWIPVSKLDQVLPLIGPPHQQFVVAAAQGRYSRSGPPPTDRHSPELIVYLREYLGRPDLPNPEDSIMPPPPPPPLPVPTQIAPLVALIKRTRNILLYGPPGTGKTWTVQQLTRFLMGAPGVPRGSLTPGDSANAGVRPSEDPPAAVEAAEGRVEFVTFHQSFAYEEFVEGLKPSVGQAEGSGISYRVEPGIFRRICRRATAAWQAHLSGGGTDATAPVYLLIIDEINRANIAKVFGELITLIEDDKRLGQPHALRIRLPYSGDLFGVPPNLYIVGTLNTADRSIALLDLALRRRFAFLELPPREDLLSPPRWDPVPGLDLGQLLRLLNERISVLIDRDHTLGHSYFLQAEDADALHFIWYHRIIPLLEEYFYNDGHRLQAVLGPEFVEQSPISKATRQILGDLYDPDTLRYRIKHLPAAELVAALGRLSAKTQPPALVGVTDENASDEEL